MAAEDLSQERKLSEIFDDGFAVYESISKSSEATNSGAVQALVKSAMRLLEEATRLVSAAGLFSSNENIDEVSTNDIKFLLLPALLGTLTLKLSLPDRLQVVQTAEVYFRDFLTRCKDYGIVDCELPESNSADFDNTEEHSPRARNFDLVAAARDRNAKIQRYKEQKALEMKLEELKKSLAGLNIDDDVKRDYYLTLVKSHASQALDELSSIEMEKPLIAHMEKVKKSDTFAEEKLKSKQGVHRPPPKPLTPIIITRDDIQKKVFGAGYPSLPTMTVQEFYDKRVKDGDFPDPSTHRSTLQDLASIEDASRKKDAEEEAAEQAQEQDDPEQLARARAWDEFKDEHRRGFGNRMNRS